GGLRHRLQADEVRDGDIAAVGLHPDALQMRTVPELLGQAHHDVDLFFRGVRAVVADLHSPGRHLDIGADQLDVGAELGCLSPIHLHFPLESGNRSSFFQVDKTAYPIHHLEDLVDRRFEKTGIGRTQLDLDRFAYRRPSLLFAQLDGGAGQMRRAFPDLAQDLLCRPASEPVAALQLSDAAQRFRLFVIITAGARDGASIDGVEFSALCLKIKNLLLPLQHQGVAFVNGEVAATVYPKRYILGLHSGEELDASTKGHVGTLNNYQQSERGQ